MTDIKTIIGRRGKAKKQLEYGSATQAYSILGARYMEDTEFLLGEICRLEKQCVNVPVLTMEQMVKMAQADDERAEAAND